MTSDNRIWHDAPPEGLEDRLLAGTENLARRLSIGELVVRDEHNEGVDRFPLSNGARNLLHSKGYSFRPLSPTDVAQKTFASCNGEPCIPGNWVKSIDGSSPVPELDLPAPYGFTPAPTLPKPPKPMALRLFPFLYSRETREYFAGVSK